MHREKSVEPKATVEVEMMMILEIRKGHNKTGCEIISSRLPFPGKVGPDGLSRSLPTRAMP